MTRHTLSPDNALAFVHVACKSEASDTIALCSYRLVFSPEPSIKSCTLWLFAKSTMGPDPPMMKRASSVEFLSCGYAPGQASAAGLTVVGRDNNCIEYVR
jgi:hypothetical protein